jgi:hypothetical protein
VKLIRSTLLGHWSPAPARAWSKLSDQLAEHFDPKRARSLQRQLPTIVSEATAGELRRLLQETLSESGAVGAQIKLFSSSNTEILERVNTLLGRIEQKLGLDEQIERSAPAASAKATGLSSK